MIVFYFVLLNMNIIHYITITESVSVGFTPTRTKNAAMDHGNIIGDCQTLGNDTSHAREEQVN